MAMSASGLVANGLNDVAGYVGNWGDSTYPITDNESESEREGDETGVSKPDAATTLSKPDAATTPAVVAKGGNAVDQSGVPAQGGSHTPRRRKTLRPARGGRHTP